MKIVLPLVNPAFDDERIAEDLQDDFRKGCQIYVYKDEGSWVGSEDESAFSVWIEYGNSNQRTLMFDTGLDDLEMFANSLLKSVEMLRRDYSETIKEKIRDNQAL